MSEHRYTNRLVSETSPYLLQHAHNPVDWYPWGDEALQMAKQKDMPILLSIGYSACHWCHVMEHESFENEKIADMMNRNFVCIKVDREERPDLDEIYMNAVQAMTGSGGWPMTLFLTPDLKPFYSGTYFPPHDIHGRPGFVSVINALAKYYKEQRDKIEKNADLVVSAINDLNNFSMSENAISYDFLGRLYKQSINLYDDEFGGFGNAPKFPQTAVISFLMRYWKKTGASYALEIVENSLQKMANGGIYDQLGGGFHRYSVDEKWLVPHFEKMLYDNAILSKAYLEAYQITKNGFYRNIASETLNYVIRELYNSEGGFYSAQDADSEGVEGKYYVWDIDEIQSILGNDAKSFANFYGLTKDGNFEHGKNILHISDKHEDNHIIQEGKAKLLRKREKRVKPSLDDKILTSWNGLMISSMAFGYQLLKNELYLNSACKTAELILTKMSKNGMLLRTYKNGIAKLNAYAEDYAFFINALIDIYEATYDAKWIKEAIRLNNLYIQEFWDNENGGFFYTGKSHEALISRLKPSYDGAIPSANSISAMNMVRLAKLTGDTKLSDKAEIIFRLFLDQMEQSPFGFSQMFCVLDFWLADIKEIVIVGRRTDEVEKALDLIYNHYIPNKILVYCDPSESSEIEKITPLLEGRIIPSDKIQIYICENYVCKSPISDIDALEDNLV